MAENKTQNRDYGWAIFLVFIGLIFLLNTTGTLDWGIWMYLLRYWPVFLILGGLKLMLRDSLVSRIILGVISFIAWGLVFVLSYYQYNPLNNNWYIPIFNNSYKTEQNQKSTVIREEDYPNVTERIITLKIPAAEFSIVDDESTNLLVLDATYTTGIMEPQVESTQNAGVLTTTFSTKSESNLQWPRNVLTDFSFTFGQPNTPVALNVDLGAGQGTLSLDKQEMKALNINVGAGDLNVTLNENSLPPVINVDIGAGQASIVLPSTVGYIVNYKVGVGAIEVENETIAHFGDKGNSYTSANYNTATQKVTITAEVGVGTLNINTK